MFDRPTIILWLFSFAYTLPVYDKYWLPFDEGIILVATQMFLAGEVPYKDFFIVMYPPGQIYVLAALFKLFSSSIIAGRIYAVLVSVASAMLVFFIARMLTKNLAISIFAWFMALASGGPRLGAIPTPIWPGMLLGLASIYIFMRYLENFKPLYIFCSGLISGAAITFRHDIGIFSSVAILIPLLVDAFNRKALKNLLFFILGILVVVTPWLIYFMNISASRDLFNSLIRFTFIHQRTAAIPFPRPCLDPKMIFHGSLHFINVNQFYIPILAFLSTLYLLLIRRSKVKTLSLVSILLFGIFTFNQVRVRSDPAHLLTVIGPTIILSAFIINDTLSSKFNLKPNSFIRYAMSIIISILLMLLLVKNVDKYIKNTYTKVYKKRIVRTIFDKGAIYLPREESEDVLDTIRFIRNRTSLGERIYIGNIAHWKDDFGGSLIIYYLSDRLPSTKFYELVPGLVTEKKVQQEIMDSLKRKDVKLIVLQDVDIDEEQKKSSSRDSFILDDFIQRNYGQIAKFGKYNIYYKR